ncbi:hypothetical protein CN448_31910 [Bacillus cereus]|uniref:DUF4064 domain-containing protein n=1 Tax=Bacillus cereus TaxID=1396 RepID=UPI000BF7418D|nr:DUF4064 domain-containing protein [Bacillus cereus]PEW57171.1 hypothetical protein CN448_31910 [Bacillus cereus]
MKQTTEFVFGLISGIFDVLGAVLTLMIGGMGAALEAEGANSIIGLGWAAVGLSNLGIVGSVVVKNKAKAGGIMMTIAAIGGLICIFVFYILPGILLLIGRLVGIFGKDKAFVSA